MYYDRIDSSEGIDVAKNSNSKECIVCHYWYFSHGFVTIGISIMGLNFKNLCCNGCYHLTILCPNLSDIAIITVKVVDYCSIFITVANLAQFTY